MDDQRLPLEQRIGSLRDGDTTDHGTPIGSTPLAVQPPRTPDMDEQTPHLLGGDIVERLRKSGERPHCYCALFQGYAAEAIEAANEIERLRSALAVAAGMISTLPQYQNKHPQEVFEMLMEEAQHE